MGNLKPILLAKTVLGGGGGGALKLGVLRPDAELIQRWTYDKKIVADEGKTIPAYSTSTTALLASANLDAYTCPEADRDLYDYYIVQRGIATPVYNAETIVAGRCEYTISCFNYDISVFNSSAFGGTGRSSLSYGSLSYVFKYYTPSVYLGKTTTTSSPACTFAAPTLDITDSSIKITPKSAILNIKGNATYFSSAAWAMLTDVRYQYIIELYKIKKGKGIDGAEMTSVYNSALNDINNNNGKLR